LLGY